MSRLLVLVTAALLAAACQSTATAPESGTSLTDGLVRDGTGGPFVAGARESFRLALPPGSTLVRWSATSGELSTSGAAAQWKLPPPGVATLTATLKDGSGEERTESWDFQVVDGSLLAAQDALQASPSTVPLPSAPPDIGSFCDLAYDSSNNVHLAFRDDTHPGLWWGKWNGSAWTIEFVDGMGFNVGGQVQQRFSLAVDPSGTPHLAYVLDSRYVWYATRTSSGWVREKVADTTSAPAVSLALDPSQGNRPTIAWYTPNSSNYDRVNIAFRTGANAWTASTLTFSVSTTYQRLQGDIAIDAAGIVYIPFWASYDGNIHLGAWDKTNTFAVSLLAGSSQPYMGQWANAAWGGAGKLLIRTQNGLFQVSLATPLTSSTMTWSAVESSGSSVGDVAYAAGKPFLMHLHGSNVEVVTTIPGNYWTYTQLATASGSAQPALAVSSSGNASICYQSGGKLYFQ